MEKDEFFLKRIRELANISYQRDIVTFSDFLNLNEQNIINAQKNKLSGIIIESFGGYSQAERKIYAFRTAECYYDQEYPIDCLKIEPKAIKFSEKLNHRDYLGALLNLGVDRNTIGDILVNEDAAWVFCQRKMTDFFLENLCRVRHTNINISLVTNPEDLPQPHMESISGTCASVRLDSLIALAFQASRSSMVSCIESGTVFVNGRLITSNGYEPKEGDIISVRGKGRFSFEGATGTTKKGRICVHLKKNI